jgi:hypothetical protein
MPGSFPTPPKGPPKKNASPMLKPTKASAVGGNANQLQKMAKNRLRK